MQYHSVTLYLQAFKGNKDIWKILLCFQNSTLEKMILNIKYAFTIY